MGKYFGTDGIRGKFNELLTIDLTLKIAMSASIVFKKHNPKAKICLGSDPRISSKIIENALVAGLTSGGTDVVILGVVTTPVISHTILNNEEITAGIMISASHNPYYDNGIKFFGADGKKLSDEITDEIELLIDRNVFDFNDNLGTIFVDKTANDMYSNYVAKYCGSLNGLNIALDTANGSSCYAAPKIFEELGANVYVIGNDPDGYNINSQVGSTYTNALSEYMTNSSVHFDFGFAFDGDGDRLMMFDGKGKVYDGDYILFAISKHLKENGKLKNNICVSTVMANLGFKKAIENLSIDFHETSVGDRYVMEELDNTQASIGGEQSGHIIMPEMLPTGDGILIAVYLSEIISKSPDFFSNIVNEMKKYPQQLVNIVTNNKDELMNDKELLELIAVQEQQLEGNGRILVRPSGTEQLVRVMVEAPTIELCESTIAPILSKIKKM